MQNFLRKFVIGCLWIVPFLALYIADGHLFGGAGLFFPFISGKNFAFRTIVELALGAYVILAIRDASYRPRLSKVFFAYSAFIIILLVADIFGADPMKSLFSNYERMEGFMMHIHLFAYFVMLVAMVRTPAEWKATLNVFVVSNVTVLSVALMQLMGSPTFIFAKIAPAFQKGMAVLYPIHQSSDRLDSTIGNASYYAIYALLFAFISAILFTQTKKIQLKWVYGVIIVLNLLTLFYTGTRGAMIGAFLGLLFVSGVFAWKGSNKTRKISLAVLLISVLLVGGLFFTRNSNFVKNSSAISRVTTIFDQFSWSGFKTTSRYMVWNMSYQAFKEKPLLGYGQDNFQYIFAKNFDPGMHGQEPWFDRSHDVFFDWLMAGGILGLLTYLSLFVVAFWMIWFRKGSLTITEQALLSGALITYFVHNIFVFDNLTSYIIFFTVLAYISTHTEVEAHNKKHLDLKDFAPYAEPFVALIIVASLWYVNYLPYKANTLLIAALDIQSLQQQMNTSDVIKSQNKSFNDALALNTFGNIEIREQFMQTASKLASLDISKAPQDEQENINKTRKEFIDSAIAEINKVAPTQQNDVRELGVYGNFYLAIGDYVNAEKYLLQAHKLSPKKQIASFDLVRAYLGEKKLNEAYDLAKETYLYDTKFDDVRGVFVITSAYDKKLKETQDLLVKNGQTIPATGEVINALVQAGEIQTALGLLAQLKKEHPEMSEQVDAYIKQMFAPKK